MYKPKFHDQYTVDQIQIKHVFLYCHYYKILDSWCMKILYGQRHSLFYHDSCFEDTYFLSHGGKKFRQLKKSWIVSDSTRSNLCLSKYSPLSNLFAKDKRKRTNTKDMSTWGEWSHSGGKGGCRQLDSYIHLSTRSKDKGRGAIWSSFTFPKENGRKRRKFIKKTACLEKHKIKGLALSNSLISIICSLLR